MKNVPSKQDIAIICCCLEANGSSQDLNIITIPDDHGFGRKTIVSEMKWVTNLSMR